MNSFCRHLSNGCRVYVNNNAISWMPCCYWDGPAIDFAEILPRRKAINISTPWAHQECQKCRREEQYKTGYRKAGLNVIPDGIPDSKIAWLDIQADITCNGGCLICGPWNSSYWQNELARYSEFQMSKTVDTLQKNVDRIFDTLDVSELRLIQFLGGEPFLSDVDKFALPYVKNADQCEIKYTTNGSVYPKEDRIQRWKDFKSVMINFSIDGIGDRFEYLRYPLKWNKVHDNVRRIIDNASDKMRFHINHTLTPLNIFYYNEFEQWVDKTFPKEKFAGIHAHSAYGVMSVSSTGTKLREKIKQVYGVEHNLTKMLADNPHTNNGFWKYITTWDQRRSQRWQSVFPEIAHAV